MKLYYSKGACSLAVRIVIHELELKAEFESVDLKTKQTEKGDDFFKINPKGAVPALCLDDHQLLTENAVIQQYLADKHQAHHLLPAIGDFNRYRVLEWLNFVSTDLHKGCGPLFNANVPQEIKDTVFKPALKKKLDVVEQQLDNKDYLLGKNFTLPDAYLFVVMRWLNHLGLDMKIWPNMSRYFAALKERKSIKQALQEEGLS